MVLSISSSWLLRSQYASFSYSFHANNPQIIAGSVKLSLATWSLTWIVWSTAKGTHHQTSWSQQRLTEFHEVCMHQAVKLSLATWSLTWLVFIVIRSTAMCHRASFHRCLSIDRRLLDGSAGWCCRVLSLARSTRQPWAIVENCVTDSIIGGVVITRPDTS